MLKISITGGPSREELFDGLRLFFEKREVHFLSHYAGTGSHRALQSSIIKGIESLDDVGERWKLKLYLWDYNIRPKDLTYFHGKRSTHHGQVKNMQVIVEAEYSTRTRKGFIIVPDSVIETWKANLADASLDFFIGKDKKQIKEGTKVSFEVKDPSQLKGRPVGIAFLQDNGDFAIETELDGIFTLNKFDEEMRYIEGNTVAAI
ncbi:MAG TPA: hypothetical protein VF941_00605 [Clostridia bacterium]